MKRRVVVHAFALYAYVLLRFGISIAGFVPKTYVQQVVENSDFRKYDDGLRMILDCTPELEHALDAAPRGRRFERDRAIRFAPAGCGDDDLLHAVGAAQRPRAFHRRRAGRLCLGSDGAEGDAGLIQRARPPGLAAAQSAADAAFDLHRIRTRNRDAARVALAVVGIVDLAGPFIRADGRMPANKDSPNDRPPASAGLGFLSSTWAFPVAESIGSRNHTTRRKSQRRIC